MVLSSKRHPRTVAETLQQLPRPSGICERPPPLYYYSNKRGAKLGFAVSSMKDHTTDEGWQIFQALENAGYDLVGNGLPNHMTDVQEILKKFPNPSVIVIQDKREWDVAPRDFRDHSARFHNMWQLNALQDTFKVTILKDAHSKPYYDSFADEVGMHAWIHYYHPALVKHLAPYVRKQHLIRTYHSVDSLKVPAFHKYQRKGALLSGALSRAYPMRLRLSREFHSILDCDFIGHPGYHRNGTCTPAYLDLMSQYKVAICTSSWFGYSLRKIIEATACGCRVITDLPTDELMPQIDDNLVRVHPDTTTKEVDELVRAMYDSYNPELQRMYAKAAQYYYDYRAVGMRLFADIEHFRSEYNSRG